MSAIGKKLRFAGDRILFKCPGCKTAHSVIVDGSRGWTWNGDDDKPTITPSVLVTYNGADAGQDQGAGVLAPPAVCHSFITHGRILFLGDCTHALAGQTVDLPDFETPLDHL